MKVINFSKISNRSLTGKLLRFPLKLIPRGCTTIIIQGNNRGYRWVVGSCVHGYWFGSYEFFKEEAISSPLKEGMVAYDIGAHAGFYKLLFARLCGVRGFVYAF
ncbi:MAG: hypothetical protein WBD99_13455 [Thermodesulfobacteriota bacterium]